MDNYISMIENKKLILTKNKNFLFLIETTKYEFYLHKELDEFDYLETDTLLMKLKNNKSGVVFYNSDLNNICLFIHNGINTFYDIGNEEINLAKDKSSYNEIIDDDIKKLLEEVELNSEEIKRISAMYS